MAEKKLSVIEILICAATTAAIAALSGWFLFTAPFTAAPAIYIWMRGGKSSGIVATMLTAALTVVLCGNIAPIVIAMSLPAMLAVGVCVSLKKRAFITVAVSASAVFVGAAAIAIYVRLTTGSDVAAYYAGKLAEAAKTDGAAAFIMFYIGAVSDTARGTMSVSSLFNMMMDDAAIQQYAVEATTLGSVSDFFAAQFSTIIPYISVIFGIVNVAAPRAVAKKLRTEVIAIPSFSRFILPRKVSVYFFITFILGLLPEVAGIDNLVIAGNVLYCGVGAVFVVQGLSFVYFYMAGHINIKAIRILILAVLYVITSMFGFNIFMWLGMFEQLVRIREGGTMFGRKDV